MILPEEVYTSLDAEYEIVGRALVDPGVVKVALGVLEPGHFYDSKLGSVWRALTDLEAKGETIDMVTVVDRMKAHGTWDDVGYTFVSQLIDYGGGNASVPALTNILKKHSMAREFRGLCVKTLEYLDRGKYTDGGRKLADALTTKTLKLYASEGVASHEPKADILDRLFMESLSDTTHGVELPWDNLNQQIGPLVPGEILGITAFSGQGKTTLDANLFVGLAEAQIPQIVFSTEMGARWLSRAAAAFGWASQKNAEKNMWGDDALGRRKYQSALQRMKEWEFEIVTVGNITPTEIANRTRVLRQRWPNQTVVVHIDHLHRLDYGRKDPNEAVGSATKLLKDMASEDRNGGMVVVALFQPRKPPEIEFLYRPVAAHQIRGNSMVWNELDIHISPYRTHVKLDPLGGSTPWGTPKAWTKGSDGMPVRALEAKDGETKIADEFLFVAVDKRRIGGPGDEVVLHFHAPSGRITEKLRTEKQFEMEV